LGLLTICLILYLYSPHYALLIFTALLGGLLLGSLVGYGVFAWKPTISQFLLTLAMIAETVYGWSIQDYYLDV
jgi:ribose/xylose/arabinose/galactoside ABC-type transport system permease subunit